MSTCFLIYIYILYTGGVHKKVMWHTANVREKLVATYGMLIDRIPDMNWSELKKKHDAYIDQLNGIYEKKNF